MRAADIRIDAAGGERGADQERVVRLRRGGVCAVGDRGDDVALGYCHIAGDARMKDLYESDILVWSEQQADLLRRLAHGERVNDQLDWQHLIEEVESVGSEQLHAVESLLFQALVHMLKAQGWPLSRDVETWRADAGACAA